MLSEFKKTRFFEKDFYPYRLILFVGENLVGCGR
jgi:hypothetical protein